MTRNAEPSGYFYDRVTTLGYLTDGFILELGGKLLLTRGTASDSSKLAIRVSTIPGDVHAIQRSYRIMTLRAVFLTIITDINTFSIF